MGLGTWVSAGGVPHAVTARARIVVAEVVVIVVYIFDISFVTYRSNLVAVSNVLTCSVLSFSCSGLVSLASAVPVSKDKNDHGR